MPKRQHQPDGEDSDEQGQHGRRRTCALPPNVAQGHLRADLPGARHQHDNDAHQRSSEQQDSKHRQHQVQQHRCSHTHQDQGKVPEIKVFRHRQFADDEDDQAEEDAQHQQESEGAVDRCYAQHHIILEDHDRQRAEEHGEYDQ